MKYWVGGFNLERFVFGILVIGGYYGMGFVGAALFRDNPAGLQITNNAMLSMGPLVGIIVQSIWKANAVDKQNADTAQTLAAKSPDMSIPNTTASTILTSPAETDQLNAAPNTENDSNNPKPRVFTAKSPS